VGAYENLGCPWSEHVAMARADPGENRCLDLARRHFPATLGAVPPRLISVFDTSPNESSFVSREKLAGFLEGVLRMMEEDPSSGYLFKMKTPWEEIARDFPDLAPLYERIRASPRCLLLEALSSEVSEAIAISDLVVSACFTSPTIEALGARQKAIYYDADGSFRGCYYDRFPRLVAHGYGELREIVDYWLTAATREDLDRFLDTQVRGELDAFVDGKGITRFRAMLLA
ncbi:MAG: polysaccharide biosynthesis PFTS motif protein, partial [Methanomicrobiales archaeon]|nr:polysaccharide biosynthesis PFTS motif protein [Methanomicrobiales archaeon]